MLQFMHSLFRETAAVFVTRREVNRNELIVKYLDSGNRRPRLLFAVGRTWVLEVCGPNPDMVCAMFQIFYDRAGAGRVSGILPARQI